jgi:hypothetical protein
VLGSRSNYSQHYTKGNNWKVPSVFRSNISNYVRQFEIRLDKYWEHQDVKFEYKASIQNEENTGNHTEISCITEEVEVDIVAESQRPQMT